MKEPEYIKLANKIEHLIDSGIYKAEDKLPSLRSLHRENGLSIGTILQAFNHLIDRGVLTSRVKSGYFVNYKINKKLSAPTAPLVSLSEQTVHIDQLLQKLHKDSTDRKFVSFANAMPDNKLLPFNSIKSAIQNISRDITGSYLALEERSGNLLLRDEIAKRSFLWRGALRGDELIITNGAKEALICCLKATTKPGDTILVQDPCYYGILQVLEYLDLKVATVPSNIETGIKLEDVYKLYKALKIKACLLVSNFNNPDGACLSSETKKLLSKFASDNQVPIIEDDLYGELFFKGNRPDTIKTYDTDGWVLYCSSFTKSLMPGFRLGWCAPGRFTYEVSRIKGMMNGSVSNLIQKVVHRLLITGAYDRHLQKFRLALQKNMLRTIDLIESHFPEGTKISRPNGGLVMWVELPLQISTSGLYDKAFELGVAYAPGELFSAKGDYLHYMRLNYCNYWEAKTENALIKLGKLLRSMENTGS